MVDRRGRPAAFASLTSDPGGTTLARGAGVAALGTALSRITGFLRLSAMAYALGITESKLADTYQLANSTPNIVFELVLGGILSSIFIRLYIEVRDTEGLDEAARFISRITNTSFLVLGGVAAVGIFASPFIFRLYTFGASDDAAQVAVGALLLALFIPQIVFYGLSQISTAVLEGHRRFGVTRFSPVINNLVVTATFLVFAALVPEKLRTLAQLETSSIVLLGLGTTAGVAALGLIPYLHMRRLGLGHTRRAGIKDPRMKRLVKLSAWLLGYVVTNQMGLWLALVLANRVQGGVAGYQTAFVFFQLPHGLLAVSIATVVYTSLAEKAVRHDMDAFAETLSRGLRGIVFFLMPAIAGYLALARPIVRLLLEHGVTGRASTEMIAVVLRVWAPGILFFSIFYMVLRSFYALGDTRTPTLIHLAAFTLNASLNLALFFAIKDPQMKIAGLAVSHAISYVVAAGIGLWALRRRTGQGSLEGLVRTTLISGAISIVTGVAAWAIADRLQGVAQATITGQAVQVSLAAGAGLLIYISISKLAGVEEIRWIKAMVTRER